jgi:hypothetical protein
MPAIRGIVFSVDRWRLIRLKVSGFRNPSFKKCVFRSGDFEKNGGRSENLSLKGWGGGVRHPRKKPNMKPNFQAGRASARGMFVASRLAVVVPSLVALSGFVLPAVAPAENRDPLAEARAVLAVKRDEADQRRNAENPTGWSRMTNRSASQFQKNDEKAGPAAQAAKTAQGPSPFNPKFGAPTFQMPSSPAQDTTAPQLKQFHPTEDPNAEPKHRFLSRDRGEGEETCPEDAERRARNAQEGKKSTLSYSGEAAAKEKQRTYDEIYQSKSPYALPTFQMPAGPAAALAAPGAQTWGGRVLQQYRPEMQPNGLEKARMQREQRAEEKEARRNEGGSGVMGLFDRSKKMESR